MPGKLFEISQSELGPIYEVKTLPLEDPEYDELRDAISPEGLFRPMAAVQRMGGGFDYYHIIFPVKVLLPIAGAIGKSILDVIVDRVKKWLSNRKEDRTVKIYGPDGTVISVVKKDGKISTE